MANELMLVVLVAPEGTKFDWGAGHAAVDDLSSKAVQAYANEVSCDLGEAAKELHEAIDALRDRGDAGDLTEITLPGYKVLLAGGMSRGEDPSDAYEMMTRLGYAPDVLAALGFYSEWPTG